MGDSRVIPKWKSETWTICVKEMQLQRHHIAKARYDIFSVTPFLLHL